jgi:hypothetical protein
MTEAIVGTKDLAEALSYWATISGIIIALVAGLSAYWKYRKDRESHDWDRAREAFTRFNALAIDNPQFHPGCWTNLPPDNLELRNKFEWYAGAMLWACEEIYFSTEARDRAWLETVRILIRDHVDYFSSPEFAEDRGGYAEPILDIIDQCCADAALSRASDQEGSGQADLGTGTDFPRARSDAI